MRRGAASYFLAALAGILAGLAFFGMSWLNAVLPVLSVDHPQAPYAEMALQFLGSFHFLFGIGLVSIFLLGLPIMAVASLIELFLAREPSFLRRCTGLLALFSAGTIVAFTAMQHFGPDAWAARLPRFTTAIERAAPLIAAIEQFHEDQSRYPEELGELIPDYLPEIPATGLLGHPEFSYHAYADHWLIKDYELSVNGFGIGFMFDQFIYWPDGEYPEEVFGKRAERIGEWAYLFD